MITDGLQIAFLLVVTAGIVAIYYRIHFRRLEKDKDRQQKQLNDIRTKYNYLISKREQLEQEQKFLKEEAAYLKEQQQTEITKNRDLQRKNESAFAKIKFLEEYKERYENEHKSLKKSTKEVEQLSAGFRNLEVIYQNLKADFELQTEQLEEAKANLNKFALVQTKYNRLVKENQSLEKEVERYIELKKNLEKNKKELINKNKENAMLLISKDLELSELEEVKIKYGKLLPKAQKLERSKKQLEEEVKMLNIEQAHLNDRLKEIKSLANGYKNAVDLLKSTSEF